MPMTTTEACQLETTTDHRPRRLSHNRPRAVEDDPKRDYPKRLNLGLTTAWGKATDRNARRTIIDTANARDLSIGLCYEEES